jgi:hypothetical protein
LESPRILRIRRYVLDCLGGLEGIKVKLINLRTAQGINSFYKTLRYKKPGSWEKIYIYFFRGASPAPQPDILILGALLRKVSVLCANKFPRFARASHVFIMILVRIIMKTRQRLAARAKRRATQASASEASRNAS